MALEAESFDYSDLSLLPIEPLEDVNFLKIMYSPSFTQMISRFNALIAAQEYTARALAITTEVISKVPSHYTAWQYRLAICKKLYVTLEEVQEELNWCGEVAQMNEKNYQIWHYREQIIAQMITTFLEGDYGKYDIDTELQLVNEMLDADEKNYHVWTHRRWLLSNFALPGELSYTDQMLQRDVWNNSVWSYRMLLVAGDDDRAREIEYTLRKIEQAPTNASAWSYLRGLCSLESLGGVLAPLVNVYGEDNVHFLSLWADVNQTLGHTDVAAAVWEKLAQIDPIHAKFYQYKGKK